ncbi:hypothetical protein ABT132_29185, partial [Streptomyces mirabilis]
ARFADEQPGPYGGVVAGRRERRLVPRHAARTGSLTPGKDADVILRALGTGLLESRDRVAAAAGVPLDGTWRPQPKTA